VDFRVTVRTYTGAVRVVEVSNMPDEEAARAEAVGMTFGKVLQVECLDEIPEQSKPKKKRGPVQEIERELRPGETETIVTGYNSNPLAVFFTLDIF